ncbi:MAG: hypothetical protein QM654_15360 [Dysgonamonadaceae bacterium]
MKRTILSAVMALAFIASTSVMAQENPSAKAEKPKTETKSCCKDSGKCKKDKSKSCCKKAKNKKDRKCSAKPSESAKK